MQSGRGVLFPNVGGPRFAKDDRIATLGGPPASLQAAGPPGISSRDSLPALNAMPGVQVPHPVQCVRRGRAFVCRRRSQGHPHGPPQFAGRSVGAGKGLPSTRSCARNTQAESSGIPCCCILSVSVSCRTRSRRPTPSRPAPGRRVKGKISRQGGVERGLCFIRRPSSEKVWLNAGCFLFVLELPCINAGTGLCLRRIALSSTHCPASVCKEHSRLHAASVCKGQPCISAPFSLSCAKVGRITTLQGPRVPSGTRAAGHK